jgi:hypothetical protein
LFYSVSNQRALTKYISRKIKEPHPPPVTLPKLSLPDLDIEHEAREAAARVAEKKTIRAGLDAWQAIGKAGSFASWRAIGKALAVGKAHALKASGAKQAWGSGYSRAFCDWTKRHGFERMPKSVRSVAIELHENISAITAWRETLPDRERRRLIHPLSNVRRWRKSLQPKKEPDALAQAETALARFLACMTALPPAQAAPLWQAAYDQALRSLTLSQIVRV